MVNVKGGLVCLCPPMARCGSGNQACALSFTWLTFIKQKHAQREFLFFHQTYFTTVHLQMFPNTSNLCSKCKSHRGTAIHLGPVALSRNTAETYTLLFKLLLEQFALTASLYKCNFTTAAIFDANTFCAFYLAREMLLLWSTSCTSTGEADLWFEPNVGQALEDLFVCSNWPPLLPISFFCFSFCSVVCVFCTVYCVYFYYKLLQKNLHTQSFNCEPAEVYLIREQVTPDKPNIS